MYSKIGLKIIYIISAKIENIVKEKEKQIKKMVNFILLKNVIKMSNTIK